MEAGKTYQVDVSITPASLDTFEAQHFHYVDSHMVPEDQWIALQEELNAEDSGKELLVDERGIHDHQEGNKTVSTEYINVIYRKV